MSEADTPNNQPLPEPTASMDDSTADWQDATETSEASQIVNLVIQPSEQEPPPESDTAEVTLSPPEADEQTTETRTKDADWFALVQKMRQRNRRLLDQMSEMRNALKEKQDSFHYEQTRSREQETLLIQQTEEIHTLQEQLARLFHALESSHQAAQRQQILIETLSEQLQSSQERVAQLERECSLVQQRYNEQSHQLLEAANTCRELRTRLQRQQRQTLQFKIALEKSLEMKGSTSSEPPQQSRQRSGVGTYSFVPKAQPIQPWSAEPEVDEELSSFDTLWKRPIPLEPLSAASFSVVEPLAVRPIEKPNLPSTADVSEPVEQAAAFPDNDATELELEQELLAEMTSLAEASGLGEFQTDLAEAPAELTQESETPSEASSELVLANLDDEPASASSDTEESSILEYVRELGIEAQMPDEDLWGDSSDRETDESEDVALPQSNWPSPVLYPFRSPKKRKSLAAIDLPSFPRYRPT